MRNLHCHNRPGYLADLSSYANPNYWELSTNQTGVTPPDERWFGVGLNCSQLPALSSSLCKYEPFDGMQLTEWGHYRHTAQGATVSLGSANPIDCKISHLIFGTGMGLSVG